MIPKIDVHAHLFLGQEELENLVAAARACGYSKMLLSATGRPHHQPGNDAVFQAARQHPGIIWPVPRLDLDTASLSTVEGYTRHGARALKVIDPLLPYNHPNYLPLYDAAGDAGLPVLFHAGIKARLYDGTPSCNSNHRPLYLDDVARRCPSLRIILAHVGTPWHDEALMTARVNPNVYLDMSSGSGWEVKGMDGAYWKRVLWWKDAWKKILFASDVRPHRIQWAVKVYEDMMSGAGLPDDAVEDVFHRNAETLWPEARGAS
ncbi:MAG TPA: hypothetical protein ENN09_05680 [Planctomycetes bacterium]|nr:hypothetical protein [Planctomycetota bacterium]